VTATTTDSLNWQDWRSKQLGVRHGTFYDNLTGGAAMGQISGEVWGEVS